jgi:hypothetical protein
LVGRMAATFRSHTGGAAAVWIARDGSNGAFDLRNVMNLTRTNLYRERWRSGLDHAQEIHSTTCGGGRGVEHHGDMRDMGRDLLEQFKPLSSNRGLEICEASNIAPGIRKAGNETTAHRIRDAYEHDWNGAGLA